MTILQGKYKDSSLLALNFTVDLFQCSKIYLSCSLESMSLLDSDVLALSVH